MEVMTMTIGYRPDGRWTIDDLFELPDDEMRYEIADGHLLVSPPAPPYHGKTLFLTRELLQRQAPPGIAVSNDVGVRIRSDSTYLIPDLFVIPVSGFEAHPKYLVPPDVRLAVEILSKHSRSRDLVLKRRHYASAGIPRYWIVDPFERSLAVLSLADTTYKDEVTVEAGTRWSTDLPFPLTLDPAEFCP
jgi:Uma2 family endonuclease